MIPVPRPHLFAAVAHRDKLRQVSAGALAGCWLRFMRRAGDGERVCGG